MLPKSFEAIRMSIEKAEKSYSKRKTCEQCHYYESEELKRPCWECKDNNKFRKQRRANES